MLWQERMGHIGEKGLRDMHNKGMVKYFPECNLEVDFCEHCIYGKQIRVRFPSGETREKRIIELVHSDVFGPISVPSLGGSLYYVSFIDYFSGIHGYTSQGRNMRFSINSKSLNLL
jgi:hypothetical protein